MEIKCSQNTLNEKVFDKNKICGFVDRTGNYLENLLSDLKPIKTNWNTSVGFFLNFKINNKKKKIYKEISEELEITKEFENKLIKTLSSSELIKVQFVYAALSDANTVILEDLDKYLTYRDMNTIFQVLRNHISQFKKTFIVKTNKIDYLTLNCKRFVVVENGEVICCSDSYRDLPEMYSIKEFVLLANAKGAKLNFYKDDGDLLKAIFRDLNR